MFKNYFKTAIRNLIKNKTHSIINLVGLSVAFICSILLFVMVYYELSYDSFSADGKRAFKLYSVSNGKDGTQKGSGMSYPVARVWKNDVPGIEKVTRYVYAGAVVNYRSKEVPAQIMLGDSDFFQVFS